LHIILTQSLLNVVLTLEVPILVSEQDTVQNFNLEKGSKTEVGFLFMYLLI